MANYKDKKIPFGTFLRSAPAKSHFCTARQSFAAQHQPKLGVAQAYRYQHLSVG
jgi:hypothetical protein